MSKIQEEWEFLRLDFAAACCELREADAVVLAKSLEHYLLLGDARLPRAVVERTLREISTLPFDEVRYLPAVGPKKVRNLIRVIRRIVRLVKETAGESVTRVESVAPSDAAEDSAEDRAPFDLRKVNDLVWNAWCDAVRAHAPDGALLGTFVESLKSLPRTMWFKPLADYFDLSLQEVLRLERHGPKRAAQVLDVFRRYHANIERGWGAEGRHPPLSPSIAIAEAFMAAEEEGLTTFDTALFSASVVRPLLRQLAIDVRDDVRRLVETRLAESYSAAPPSWDDRRSQAASGGTSTKPRRAPQTPFPEYVAEVIEVRWPRGASRIGNLLDRCANAGKARRLVGSLPALEIFFPQLRPRLRALTQESPTSDLSNASATGRPFRPPDAVSGALLLELLLPLTQLVHLAN